MVRKFFFGQLFSHGALTRPKRFRVLVATTRLSARNRRASVEGAQATVFRLSPPINRGLQWVTSNRQAHDRPFHGRPRGFCESVVAAAGDFLLLGLRRPATGSSVSAGLGIPGCSEAHASA